jgi:hypothetical protein
MAKFELDTDALPTLAATEAARLDAMSDDETTAAALADPDNPPLDADELARIAARVKCARFGLAAGSPRLNSLAPSTSTWLDFAI